jgi:hypothetical protein
MYTKIFYKTKEWWEEYAIYFYLSIFAIFIIKISLDDLASDNSWIVIAFTYWISSIKFMYNDFIEIIKTPLAQLTIGKIMCFISYSCLWVILYIFIKAIWDGLTEKEEEQEDFY